MQIPPQFICQLNRIFSNLKVWSACHCPAAEKAALEGQLCSWCIAVKHFLNMPDGQQLLTGRCSKEDILLALLRCHQWILKVLKQWHDIELFVVSCFLFLLCGTADIAQARLPPIEESDDEEEFNGFSDLDREEAVEENSGMWVDTERGDVDEEVEL